MKKGLILIGGGGHCKSCIDIIEQEDKYHIIGILDNEKAIGERILGYEVVGNDEEILRLIGEGFAFLITVGQMKDVNVRLKLFRCLRDNFADLPTIISPFAYVSKYASLGIGTIVMHGARINAGVQIGNNNILNTGCNIEHDSSVGNHCHISTYTVVNGDCKIGNRIFIGSGAIISSGLEIVDDVVVGAGAVLIRSIISEGTYVGNPAQILRN